LGFLPHLSDVRRRAASIGPSRISAAEALDWGPVDRAGNHGEISQMISDFTGDRMDASVEHMGNVKALFG